MAPPLRLGVMYDFRTRPGDGPPLADVYAATLDQARLIDQLGYDTVWFTEHHFVDDGYLPSVVAASGAIAACTNRVRIGSDIVLLPFYNPIRLAEDMAVLDNLSGGRMELGIGMGYAPHEFAAFGHPVKNRVSLTEEGIDVLRLAWGHEPFSYRGKRHEYTDLDVHPKPIQDGGPPLWIAAMSTAGAQRAARFGTNLLPQGTRAEVLDPYRTAVTDAGQDPSDRRVGIARSWLVTDDPDRDWPEVLVAERFRMSLYKRFFSETPDTYSWGKADANPIPQTWIVGDADHVATEILAFVETYGITDIATSGLPPGIDPDLMARSHEKFAADVLPRLRDHTDIVPV